MINKIKNFWKNSFFISALTKYQNKYYRKKLTNHHFTILSSNCVSGVLYNRLGERFDSPTVNIRINNKDFCSFIEYFDYYIKQEIKDHGPDKYNNPSGIITGDGKNIPDIVINFVHYKNFKDGQSKWNERKARINRNNTYIMMYDTDGVTPEDLKKIENFKCNNKVIFTPNKDLDVNWAFYINADKNTGYLPEFYLLRNVFGMTPIDKNFDFVSFFNKQN